MSEVAKTFENVMEFSEKYCKYLRQVAYILASIQHETGGTYIPVKEGFNASDRWRRANLRYYPYYGRGHIQITWKFNYDKYEEIVKKVLGIIPDTSTLDWVMDNRISSFIAVHGCINGIFTGLALPKYVNASKTDYLNARRVVNGMDKAKLIMSYAQSWERKLRDGQVKEFNKAKFDY